MSYGGTQTSGIIIPNTVTVIEREVFSYLGLTSITLPTNLETLGNSALRNNNLTSITLPSTLKTLDNLVFSDNQLTSITLPTNLERIGSSTFQNNSLSGHLIIPDKVTNIGMSAFQGNNLTKITVGTGATIISQNAFRKASNSNSGLTNIVNRTVMSFNWSYIVNGTSGTSFRTGTITNAAGNVSVTAS